MKSKAHIKGHPIHPILVGFPISFFVGALLTDIVGMINDTWYDMGLYLAIAGIVSGLLAAVPGIVDYTYTVPPDSSAKKRGVKHGLLNTGVIILFLIAVMYRRQSDSPLFTVVVGLEAAACILLVFAGWLGGTLVYRNQIGVDLRYANAGKWKEKYLDKQDSSRYVVEDADLDINQMMLLHAGDKRIVLAKTEDGYAAFEDRCTHRGGSLAGGALMCNKVQCPWHGSQFDVRTGGVSAGPAKEGISIYKVAEENGKIIVNIGA